MLNNYSVARTFHFIEVAFYLFMVVISVFAAFLLRFDFLISEEALAMLRKAILVAIVTKGPLFYFVGIDRGIRRFVGLPDLYRVLIINLAGSVLFAAGILLWIGDLFSRSVLVLDFILCFLLSTLVCFSERIYSEVVTRKANLRKHKDILIYGAGTAGVTLLRDIRSNPASGYRVIGFLDDNVSKRRSSAAGVRILGPGRQVAAIQDSLKKRNRWIDEIVMAIPSATGKQMQESLANCRAANIPCKTVPTISEILDRRMLADQIRNVNVSDLLGRQPVEVDESPIHQSIEGRSILVTGAAGSIGSELCRQIAGFKPSRLVAFDQAESDLFRLDSDLRDRFPNLDLHIALGNLTDQPTLEALMERHSIRSVFHAAAYKHVPMMEAHVFEAARNNILGTWTLLDVAKQRGVQNFLLISSDKAVNPTGIMGATKRVCELLVSSGQKSANRNGMKCAAVRFGNVLGSNGSVVPIFQAQIAAGGPIKVTHPDIKRYFMTISEAVLLVLQASTMGRGSEIYVLDMGEPVLIVDLAKTLIRLAGLEPYKDIDIRFSGLRPGEKLYEEMNLPSENTLPTPHEKINIFQQATPDASMVREWVGQLQHAVNMRDEREILSLVKRMVPEYRPDTSEGQPVERRLKPEVSVLPMWPEEIEDMVRAS